jgi:hypothetical protein
MPEQSENKITNTVDKPATTQVDQNKSKPAKDELTDEELHRISGGDRATPKF